MPVYPYLLAGVFRVFGVYTTASAVAILTLNCLFSALTCIAVFHLARRSFGRDVGVVAGWTWAFFPYAVYIPVHWMWETSLATLQLALLVQLAMHLEEKSAPGAWIGWGALWGLGSLTSPLLLTVLPFLGVWLWHRTGRQSRPRARLAGAAMLAFLLSVLPWFVRNYWTFGEFIPFRSNFAVELRVGNAQETDEPWRGWLHPSESPAELHKIQRMGELPYMAAKRREALEFIAAHPNIFAWLTFRRIVYVWTGIWSLAPGYLLAKPLEAVNIPFCTALTILALAGLRRAFRQNPSMAWLYALVLFSAPLVYYVTHANIRYRHTMDPFLVVLAVFAGSASTRSRLRWRRSGSS